MSEPASAVRLAVVGGGIAGLAAAHRAVELQPAAQVTLFEAADRLGGSLWTERRDGFLIEQGADSFITNAPWAVDLCRRVGLGDELLPTAAENRRVFVVRRGRLIPVPEGFVIMAPRRLWPILTSPVFSPLGKLRVAMEYFVRRRRATDDESLASFARRRLGREAFERLVQPLAAGIYTADPERLSLAATLPRFIEMERRHGSLWRGVRGQGAGVRGRGHRGDSIIDSPSSLGRKARVESPTNSDSVPTSGARYSLFIAPRDGMSSLIAAIAARLPRDSVRLGCAVQRVERTGSHWRLTWSDGSAATQSGDFDAVVIALPTPVAARLLEPIDGPLAADLGGIPYASAAVVSLTYDRQQIDHPLDGFGFVVPAIERRPILSASFSSVKFPGRAPDGKVLIRVFLGGACQPEIYQLPDAEVERIAHEELGQLLGARSSPLFSTLARWPVSMPQYHLGHLVRVARIEERVAEIPGLALAGNAYHGVGIPQAIQSGEAAAERLLRLPRGDSARMVL